MIRESVLADEGGEQMNAPFAENTGGGAGDAQRMREYLAAGSFLGANSPEA